MTPVVSHPCGSYRFLPGIDPYSCGVIANPGHEIVHVTLEVARPWREGFSFVDRFLRKQGRQRAELCAMELRSPKPFSMQGFIEFNRGYCTVLGEWGVLVDGLNPIARTNVCPIALDSPEPVLHAFSFVRPDPALQRQTFIVAGAGELVEGTLVNDGILRRGETSAEAIAEKARYVCEVMAERLRALHGTWDEVTTVNAYTIHPLHPLMKTLVLPCLPAARRHGITWHYARPPVIDIEYEMDLHGVVTRWVV
jgi:hypothetical protein